MASKDSKSNLTVQLYPKIEKSLKDKNVLVSYKRNLDSYLGANTDVYFDAGPGKRPIYSEERANEYIKLLGLTSKELNDAVNGSSALKSSWFMLKPYNVANALATRYFLSSKNEEYQKMTAGYLVVALYPPLHYRYFRHGINDACMQYTINNISNKFNIKRSDNLWTMLLNMAMMAIDLHEEGLLKGTDIEYLNYIQDVQTRINNTLKNIANVYYDNYENQRFLKLEKENFDDETYYEADSNSYAVERITNKVLTHMLMHGPDMKLVELAAQTNKVSIAEMRNFATIIIVDSKADQIREVLESILFLYLFNDDDTNLHSPEQISTNDFMIYCLQLYKRSNTTNKNIIRVKKILDEWLDEVGLTKRTSRTATMISFRKALFTFFVMEIQKYS